MLRLGHALLKKHGGPRQYLQASLPTKEDVTKFYEDVAAHFPRRSDIEYATSDTLPGDADSTFHICLSDCSFDSGSSTKPGPYFSVSLALLDEYLI